jgi:hypothetical protein
VFAVEIESRLKICDRGDASTTAARTKMKKLDLICMIVMTLNCLDRNFKSSRMEGMA